MKHPAVLRSGCNPSEVTIQILFSHSTHLRIKSNSRYAHLKAIFDCEVDLETRTLTPAHMLATFSATENWSLLRSQQPGKMRRFMLTGHCPEHRRHSGFHPTILPANSYLAPRPW